MQTKLVLPAPAKINLFLHINRRREDGYHQLQTLFQFLDYSDTLSFALRDDRQIRLQCRQKALAAELESDDNLIIRAARLLQARHAPHQGIDIQLDKILPMGGGVGGGSSDAATTLLALNRLWQLDLSLDELARLGLSLGADVPVFIHGRAVFASGIGEQFSPAAPAQHWYLVAKPECHIATAEIFRHIDLPRNTPIFDTVDYRFENTRNDCQALVKKLYPEVANTQERLLEYAPTRLTGTGACLFSAFDNRLDAEKAAEKARTWLSPTVSLFIARGLNVSPTHTVLNGKHNTL